jgi:hypothetical protein
MLEWILSFVSHGREARLITRVQPA